MTKVEVQTIITEELRKALSSSGTAGYLQLKESREAREREEARLRDSRKEAKAQRKAEKRSLKEGRRVFESLGMDRGAAKLAARGR